MHKITMVAPPFLKQQQYAVQTAVGLRWSITKNVGQTVKNNKQ